MKKIIIALLAALHGFSASAQIQDGAMSPDVSFSDTEGNAHTIYTHLSEGTIVVLNFFATWDVYSWDYQQSGELETFYTAYGPAGSGQVVVYNVESEASNSTAMLSGPESITGDLSTDTYGDWISNTSIPFVDDAAMADSFQISYLPTLLFICPDGMVWESGQFSSGTLEGQLNGGLCGMLTDGFNPAIIQPRLERTCGSNVADFVFTLKNLGTEPLDAVTFQLTNVSGEPQALWTGTLNPYQSNEITVSDLILINDDPVGVHILTPNALEEDDSLSVTSAIGFSHLSLRLELALDNYPDEFSLEIRNSEDSLIYYVDSLDVPYEYINDTLSLPYADCYSLTLFDEAGDGLHGSQWGGYDGLCRLFSLDADGNISSTLYDYDGSYNFSTVPNTPGFEQIFFEAGSTLAIMDHSNELSAMLYPNPARDILNLETYISGPDDLCVSFYDAAGRCVKQEIFRNPMPGIFKQQFLLDYLDSGIYLLHMNQSGRSFSQRFVLNGK